jgi:hypothetical protein
MFNPNSIKTLLQLRQTTNSNDEDEENKNVDIDQQMLTQETD